MRRVTLVIALAVVMAGMLALTVGSALASDTQPTQVTYIDTVKAEQYFAFPGISMFRGKAKDIPNDGDPGLNGELDTRITYDYVTGTPGPGVTTPITGGSWLLCSNVTPEPPNAQTQPVCEPSSADSGIALRGTVSDGTAAWNNTDKYATLDNGVKVYAGEAKVDADFTVTGGTVNGELVTGGSGEFEGTLNHRPLLDGEPPILKGTLKLNLNF